MSNPDSTIFGAPPAPSTCTNDLYFAAYLKAAGVPLERSVRGANGKVAFHFSPVLGNFEELKGAYFNGTGRIQALAYAFEIRNLKAVVHMT